MMLPMAATKNLEISEKKGAAYEAFILEDAFNILGLLSTGSL
jgi:hypothetical protein